MTLMQAQLKHTIKTAKNPCHYILLLDRIQAIKKYPRCSMLGHRFECQVRPSTLHG